jgi:hypothetical protein
MMSTPVSSHSPFVYASGFRIESGIPLPGKPKGNRPPDKYPLSGLAPGQCLFIPAASRTEARNTVAGVCAFFKRYRPMKFTARIVDGGVRVWRLS